MRNKLLVVAPERHHREYRDWSDRIDVLDFATNVGGGRQLALKNTYDLFVVEYNLSGRVPESGSENGIDVISSLGIVRNQVGVVLFYRGDIPDSERAHAQRYQNLRGVYPIPQTSEVFAKIVASAITGEIVSSSGEAAEVLDPGSEKQFKPDFASRRMTKQD